MTSYRNCRNCLLATEPCGRRDEIREAIKGAGITVVKFRCDQLTPLYRRGQRVAVSWPVYADDEYPELETWPATIIAESGARFLIAVDDVDSDNETPAREYVKNERLFAKVSTARLKPLDEPDRAICGWCEQAPAPGSDAALCRQPDTWVGTNYPPNCLRAAREAADGLAAQ